jgi:hypothetical protein
MVCVRRFGSYEKQIRTLTEHHRLVVCRNRESSSLRRERNDIALYKLPYQTT